MNKKDSKKHLSKKLLEKRAFKKLASIQTLVSIVAIVECLLMFIFTTYSWIETNSSLIIKNGPAFIDTDSIQSLSIADKLKYKVNLTSVSGESESWADLNDYFSSVKYFEFAKTTSPDGKTFFYPRSNNTYSNATAFRKGDTIDYNTSYLYFDFILSNSTTENFNVYFDNEFAADIFTITGGDFSEDPDENEAYKEALRKAMRMSIITKAGNAAEVPSIYAYNGNSSEAVSYQTISPNCEDLLNPTLNYNVSANSIKKYVYATNSGGVITSEKLFVARKNVDTKVSIRVWFELRDPTFAEKFGFNTNVNSYTTDIYKKIPSAKIGVKFRLKTSLNDLRALNFDDYSFSNQADATHLTDEDPNYSVWFYAYQPHVDAAGARPERQAEMKTIELQRDPTSTTFTRWTTSEATDSMMKWLAGMSPYNTTGTNGSYYEGAVANRYTKCFFCYGNYETKETKYCWELTAAPAADNGEYIYNAYSVDPTTAHTGTVTNVRQTGTTYSSWKAGVGIWQDDFDSSTMALLKLNDMTTAVTSGSYNATVSNEVNEQFLNAAADTSNTYILFANNVNGFSASNQTVTLDGGVTTIIHASGNINAVTAAMYYDSSEDVFKSYVPRYWLYGDHNNNSNRGISFTYAPSGTYNQSKAAVRWYSASPQPNDDEFVYNALGYANSANDNCYAPTAAVDTDTVYAGVGTWGDVERLSFSTELIDADLSANYRYMIGIKGYSANTYSTNTATDRDYYVMVPDDTNMTFSAYVPKDIGKELAEINFARYIPSSAHKMTACWLSNIRYTHKTFYPVSVGAYDATGVTANGTGYWNISVLVDGTYENLIYNTLTDGAVSSGQPVTSVLPVWDATEEKWVYTARHNYGKLEYSYTGADGTWVTVFDDTAADSSNIMIDRYRFYAPAENRTTVYWRWTPYKGYILSHTEAGEEVVDLTVDDTSFIYVHNTTNGIYKLITEAPNNVSVTPQQGQQSSHGNQGALRISVNNNSSAPTVIEDDQPVETPDQNAASTEPLYYPDSTADDSEYDSEDE